jgi:magnesium transporter
LKTSRTPGPPPALVPLEQLSLETAAEHVCRQVPITRPDALAGDVRRSLAGWQFEVATHIAVCEGERLAGILTIEALLRAPEGAAMRDLMDTDPPVVAPGLDQEVTAWRAVKHGESALAVVDEDGRFIGFIPPHRLLAVLLWEHDEDMVRLGGFLRNSSAALSASEEQVPRRLWHRLPWLGLGLVGAVLAADLIGAFAHHLEHHLVLAFFLPGVVYLADAVGTQTETVIVRGFSLGVGVERVLAREALTGVLVGALLALAFLPFALWRWGDPAVAATVALAILAACSTATLVGMALPWAMQRLGFDPAFGSGPLATVLQDLLSIVIYFAIAAGLVPSG